MQPAQSAEITSPQHQWHRIPDEENDQEDRSERAMLSLLSEAEHHTKTHRRQQQDQPAAEPIEVKVIQEKEENITMTNAPGEYDKLAREECPVTPGTPSNNSTNPHTSSQIPHKRMMDSPEEETHKEENLIRIHIRQRF